MGGGRRFGVATGADVPGFRLGRRGAARSTGTRVVCEANGRSETGAGVRRSVLVADSEQLGYGARPGADPARELVAERLSPGVPGMGNGAGPAGAGVCDDL